MYLKELKLNGFKSFADQTRLTFDPGVTAIVGPNGCGKSNIADAIRWVLGEQSAKALRGGKMQDVIFEGSDNRKPLGVCEVSLVFTECETHLKNGYHEIEITRCVSRDGQSDYFLNGKACRLKDIHQIFMDTGIGRTSYSIMAQGQIDQILSSNPADRRLIFEEAAGITRYKSQRKEALSKLERVEANLARLTDVIDEVRRQIATLRRQASKAVRYKKLRHRLQFLDLASNARQYGILKAEVSEKEKEISRLETQLDEAHSDLRRVELDVETVKGERSRLNERLQSAQQAVFDCRSGKEQAENRSRTARVRQSDLAARLGEARKEAESIASQIEEITERMEGSVRTKEEHLGSVESSDGVFQSRQTELAALQRELDQNEATLTRHRHEQLQLENRLTRLRMENNAFEVEEKSDEMRSAGLAGELEELREELSEAERNRDDLETALGTAVRDQADAEEQRKTAADKVEEARLQYRRLQQQIQENDRALAQTNARLRLLQQLQEKLEGFSDGAKAILQGKLDHALGDESPTALSKDVHVPPRHTKAAEALLGAAVEAVAVRCPDEAMTLVELLEQQKLGRACLCFPTAPNGKNTTAEPPAFLIPAREIFRWDEGEVEASHPLHGLLAASYVTDDLGLFFEYWKKNPGFHFRLVVTNKGEWIDCRGLLFGGHHGTRNSSLLQRQAEIEELEADLAEGQKKLAALRADAEGAQARLTDAETALEESRNRIAAAGEKKSGIEAEFRAAKRTVDEIEARLNRSETEAERLAAKREERADARKETQRLLEAVEAQFETTKKAIGETEKNLEARREERERRREVLADARLELAEKRQRLEMLDRGLSDLEERRSRLRSTLEARKREIETSEEQLLVLKGEEETQSEAAGKLESELAAAQRNVDEIRTQYSAREKALEEIEANAAETRRKCESWQTNLSRLQVKHAEQSSRLRYLVEESTREYDVDLSHFDWRDSLWQARQQNQREKHHPLDTDDDEPVEESRVEITPMTDEDRATLEETDWDEVQAEVQALRQKLQSMGPVNLVAIEEYRELKERFDFLNNQCEDLVKSRDQLVAAIDDINRRSMTQFAEIFEQIKKNFSYTFETLFGGGKSGLELLESDDVLEAGIEIIAQPPGTKLKSIVLLSGGQKTMTAVALLFAIYMVKPSPFCVLDELDAPLDEANIGRFTTMLKRFTSESQFLIITHNKRTISEAKTIFGVTMEEKGVSKIVSMRFHKDNGQPADEAALVTAETA